MRISCSCSCSGGILKSSKSGMACECGLNERGPARRIPDSGANRTRDPAPPAPTGWPWLFSFSDKSPVWGDDKAVGDRKESPNSAVIHRAHNTHIGVGPTIPQELYFK